MKTWRTTLILDHENDNITSRPMEITRSEAVYSREIPSLLSPPFSGSSHLPSKPDQRLWVQYRHSILITQNSDLKKWL